MSGTASTVLNSLFTVFGVIDNTSSIISNPSKPLNNIASGSGIVASIVGLVNPIAAIPAGTLSISATLVKFKVDVQSNAGSQTVTGDVVSALGSLFTTFGSVITIIPGLEGPGFGLVVAGNLTAIVGAVIDSNTIENTFNNLYNSAVNIINNSLNTTYPTSTGSLVIPIPDPSGVIVGSYIAQPVSSSINADGTTTYVMPNGQSITTNQSSNSDQHSELITTPGQAGNATFSVSEDSSGALLASYVESVSGQPIYTENSFQTANSGQIVSDVTTYDDTTGDEISEQIQTTDASGTPESSVDATFNSGNSPTTNVTVTDPNGSTQSYSLAGTATVQLDIDSTATAAASGPAVLVGTDNATLNGGSGNDVIVGLGSNLTVNGGTGNTQVDLVGTGETANVNGATVNLGTGGSATVSGNNNVIDANSASVSLYGSGDSGIVDNSNLTVGNGSQATLTANNDSVSSTGADVTLGGNNNVLSTSGGTTTIYGFGDSGTVDNSTLTVGSGSQTSLTANNDTVNSTGAYVTLNGDNNDLSTNGGTVVLNGSNDYGTVNNSNLGLDSGSEASLTANNDQVGYTGADLTLGGNNNVLSTYGGTTNIYGFGDTGTVDFSNLTVGSGSQASLTANYDSVNSTGADLTVSGNGNDLFNYGGTTTIYGFYDYGTVDNSNLNVGSGSEANLTTNNDDVRYTGAYLTLNGDNNDLSTYGGTTIINGTGDYGTVDFSNLGLDSGSEAVLTANYDNAGYTGADLTVVGNGNNLSTYGGSTTIYGFYDSGTVDNSNLTIGSGSEAELTAYNDTVSSAGAALTLDGGNNTYVGSIAPTPAPVSSGVVDTHYTAPAGASYTSYDDTAGPSVDTQRETNFADGSHAIEVWDTEGNQPWDKSDLIFNTSGTLTYIKTDFNNGSWESTAFEPSANGEYFADNKIVYGIAAISEISNRFGAELGVNLYGANGALLAQFGGAPDSSLNQYIAQQAAAAGGGKQVLSAFNNDDGGFQGLFGDTSSQIGGTYGNPSLGVADNAGHGTGELQSGVGGSLASSSGAIGYGTTFSGIGYDSSVLSSSTPTLTPEEDFSYVF